MADHGLSQRQPCRASGIARSTARYRPVIRDTFWMIVFVVRDIAVNPRHGFELLHDSVKSQGQPRGLMVHLSPSQLNLRQRGKTYLQARVRLKLQTELRLR